MNLESIVIEAPPERREHDRLRTLLLAGSLMAEYLQRISAAGYADPDSPVQRLAATWDRELDAFRAAQGDPQ